MKEIAVRKIGNSAGFNLSKDILKDMKIDIGDNVYLLKNKEGQYMLYTYNPEEIQMIKTAKKLSKKYKNLLTALADA